MSKHSKWAKIKRNKGIADVKKGGAFTKLGNAIAIAARSGADPEANLKLRLAIDKARAQNMPKDTIERSIARGAGTLEGQIIEEMLYEGFGPGGVAVIIEAATDNTNRTVNDLKRVLQDHGGRLGGPGSVARLFERKGFISIPDASLDDTLELALIDAGAEDIQKKDGITITTAFDRLEAVRRAAIASGLTPEESGVEWVSHEYILIPKEKQEALQDFFSALDALDDVQEWHVNVDLETL
ncbi:YebC/PmpR family DNA-binding transcriptional regulator [Candidatus Uhrbacteria bacterium]|nr:YebC/PmpR family DNA-binding transcriptional regulator [Candidatus Uhrbacteria bacterium]